MPTQKVYSS